MAWSTESDALNQDSMNYTVDGRSVSALGIGLREQITGLASVKDTGINSLSSLNELVQLNNREGASYNGLKAMVLAIAGLYYTDFDRTRSLARVSKKLTDVTVSLTNALVVIAASGLIENVTDLTLGSAPARVSMVIIRR